MAQKIKKLKNMFGITNMFVDPIFALYPWAAPASNYFICVDLYYYPKYNFVVILLHFV